MPPTFDGPNLLITLPSGVTAIDAEIDLYSEWKQWILLSDNSKYPDAFRSIGGDPLTPGLEAAPYFFLRNDFGWRIKPPEENITIFLTGNLVPEDSNESMVVPTTGAFTTMILGLQPVTQGVDALQTALDYIEAAAAGDVVVAADELSFTIAKPGQSPLASFTVSADKKTRTRN